MDRDALLSEVIELASACQTGCASDDERARLERLLEDSAEAREIYLRVADDTVTLNDVRRSVASAAAMTDADADRPPTELVETPAPAPGAARYNRNWLSWLAVAASLAIAVFGVWQLGPGSNGSPAAVAPEVTFARIVSMSDVQWAAGVAAHREWERVGENQTLRFDAGSIEVLYDNGVQFVVQGPADFDFLSESRVMARAGKLVARVGPEASGFEIVTPHAKVIDRGTSFGVTIEPDRRTDVVVYEGRVDLAVPETSTAAPRRLGAGEAVRVRSDGRVGRIASVGGDEFLPPPRLGEAPSTAGRVIVSVSDNLKSSQTAKYYRVVSHGFREDCQAFVDRQHQWNGVDERGVPPFLAGADYVMTFNDDKVQHNLRIAVELAQPAQLYLLLDDRNPPPKWLTEAFVDTGWDVGIDEGYDDREHVKTAVGAGQSIERSCSVWRHSASAPSTVLLGSLQESATTEAPREVLRLMYGIVATPLGSEALTRK